MDGRVRTREFGWFEPAEPPRTTQIQRERAWWGQVVLGLWISGWFEPAEPPRTTQIHSDREGTWMVGSGLECSGWYYPISVERFGGSNRCCLRISVFHGGSNHPKPMTHPWDRCSHRFVEVHEGQTSSQNNGTPSWNRYCHRTSTPNSRDLTLPSTT